MTRFFFELFQGLLIGAGAILPGISGASLAVAFGVYEDFMALVSSPLKTVKPFLEKHLSLCIGIAAGFVIFTLLLGTLFSKHTAEILFLFMGFIAGTLPGTFNRAREKGIGKAEVISFCISAGIFISIIIFSRGRTESFPIAGGTFHAAGQRPSLIFGTWIFAGAIIGAGSLLPGISASFILIYLGLYGPLLDALSERSIGIGLQLGSGVVISFILLSRLVAWLYKHFHGIVSFAVLGCTLGSLGIVFPDAGSVSNPWLSAILFFAGFAVSFLLERLT